MSKFGQIDFNPANQSAFGTLETAELTPVFQGDFAYGLNTQIWQPAVVSGTGATVDTNEQRLRIQSGTASNGYAYILPYRPARYRAGQGTVARFTPLFTAGIANNLQIWGMGNIVSNLPYDGYFFGYDGTSFGIFHYIRGVKTFIAQASWNGQALPFTLDPTKGSPMMIKYPYLGYGDIFFYIQNPTSGAWILVHTIRYANSLATTQLANPTLSFMGFTLNSGNTSNRIMYCGSVGVFISGTRSFVGNPRWGMDNNKSAITTETNILSIKNCTSYNGMTNRGLIRLSSLSLGSSAATGIAVIRFKIGATLGGTPAYTTINGTSADNGDTITSGNSIASYDVAGTTVTGGSYIGGVTVDNPSSQFVDLEPYKLYISPGQILTVPGFSTNASVIGVALNWSEDI
jgi:hypothetical protein